MCQCRRRYPTQCAVRHLGAVAAALEKANGVSSEPGSQVPVYGRFAFTLESVLFTCEPGPCETTARLELKPVVRSKSSLALTVGLQSVLRGQ
jgi:hypothetical protein